MDRPSDVWSASRLFAGAISGTPSPLTTRWTIRYRQLLQRDAAIEPMRPSRPKECVFQISRHLNSIIVFAAVDTSIARGLSCGHAVTVSFHVSLFASFRFDFRPGSVVRCRGNSYAATVPGICLLVIEQLEQTDLFCSWFPLEMQGKDTGRR